MNYTLLVPPDTEGGGRHLGDHRRTIVYDRDISVRDHHMPNEHTKWSGWAWGNRLLIPKQIGFSRT
jgi:hypothetical protein